MEVNNHINTGIRYKYYKQTTSSSTESFSEYCYGKNDDSNSINSYESNYSKKETVSSKELYYRQVDSAHTNEIRETNEPQMKSLGVGFLLVGDMGYGMSATQIISKDTDDVIVRVKISLGDNKNETIDVNLSEVDTNNATAVEMFAFCQYADANGTGVDDKWGSWHALKTFSSGFGKKMEYASYEEAISKKTNWNDLLAKSTLTLENQHTGKSMTASEVIQMLKDTVIEKSKLSAEDLEEKDWRDMSDEEWEKLIEDIDKYIDDIKENLEKLKELQEKAANMAASGAPSGQKALAASNAALHAATSGFVSEEVSVDDSKWIEENSWTYDMQTDDQAVLAKAKQANEVAKDALSKSQEILLTGDTITGTSATEQSRLALENLQIFYQLMKNKN
ncbi:MAG: hypothetical protein Q4F06_03985 [Eubacteriales bacterium]|nr:hypothetical protein [Eubacteriales bacterium]